MNEFRNSFERKTLIHLITLIIFDDDNFTVMNINQQFSDESEIAT